MKVSEVQKKEGVGEACAADSQAYENDFLMLGGLVGGRPGNW